MKNIVKKRFDINITEPTKIFSKIEINKQEIFPEDYETKLLMTGINVSPNHRFYEVGDIAVGSGAVKVEYKDTADGRSNFEPYRISIYLKCELAD
jgi:hypothetical protein